MKSEDFSQTDGHIGISGKIEINLTGIRQGSKPGESHRKIAGALRKSGVRNLPHTVGQNHFFRQTEQKPDDPRGNLLDTLPALGDFRLHRRIPHDRPRHQLREKCDVKSDLERISLHAGIIAVDVDDITQPLKRIKRYADRQSDLRNRHHYPHRVYDLRKKTCVLKVS